MKINWKKVWMDFDKWCDKYGMPDWRLQKRKITRIVEKQIKGKKKP